MPSLVSDPSSTRIKFKDVNMCSQYNLKINVSFRRRSIFVNLILPRFSGRKKVSGILFPKEGKDHGKSAKDLYSRV